MGMITKAKSEAPKEPVEAEEPAAEESAEPTPHAEPDTDDAGGSSDSDEDNEGGEDMPASLQPEYKRCVEALYKVLYQNEQTSRNVLDSLDPSDQGKVESVAKTSMIILHQLDEKLNMQGDVIPYMLLTIVDRLVEMLERAKKAKFSDDEIMKTCAAAFEGAKALIPNEQKAPGAEAEAPGGAAPPTPGSVPPGAAEPAPEAAEAPEASPTEEEVA